MQTRFEPQRRLLANPPGRGRAVRPRGHSLIVTKAASAIGSQMCQPLCEEGALVAAVDRVDVPMDDLRDEFGLIPSAAYVATKGGGVSFTKSPARETSPHGVRVNCVSPGPIEIHTFQSDGDIGRGEGEARTRAKRMSGPAVALAVIYPISEKAWFVTGGVL